MVVVKVIDPNDQKEYSYHIDKRLYNQLNKKVKGALTKKDEDYVITIDGCERAGKSVFAMQLGKYIDPTLSIDRICFSPDEFRQAIIKAQCGQCVIFDEAYRGLSAKGALTEMNRILVSLMMEMGQKNLFVIIVLPTFYLIEKYVALWRTRGLFHVYRKNGRKGNWVFFNKKKLTRLYLRGKKDYSYRYERSRFRGRFANTYAINEQLYREKKNLSLKKGFVTTRSEKLREQRDRLVLYMYKHQSKGLRDTSELLKPLGVNLSHIAIKDIVDNMTKRP